MQYISEKIRYFVYPRIADMRCGFNGLCTIIQSELGTDPTNGDAFVFFSKNRSQIKILLWEGDGFSIYFKRLEGGSFEVPECRIDGTGVYIDDITLIHILRGILIKSGRYKKRFTGPAVPGQTALPAN